MGQLILNSFKDKYNFVHLIDSLSKYNSKIIDDVDILSTSFEDIEDNDIQ